MTMPRPDVKSQAGAARSVVVRDESRYRDIEPLATAQRCELDESDSGWHLGADLAQERDAGCECASGCKQIVHHHDAVSRTDRIGLYLDSVHPILERVVVRDNGAWQLAALAEHDEAAAELQRERGCNEEAPRLDACEKRGTVRPDHLGQTLHRELPCLRIPQQGRDVAKQDARLWKVRYGADVSLEIHAGGCIPPISGEQGSAGPSSVTTAPIRPTSRVPVASVAGVVFILAYVFLAVTLPDLLWPQHWAVQALYWCVAGVAWVFPIWALMVWAVRRR